MRTEKWNGNAVRKHRAYWRPLLPQPCCRCGLPVFANPSAKGEGWQVDHWPIPREFGGTETRPAHAHCNLSAGGKRGAQITNERRRKKSTRPNTHEEVNNIRGV